MPNLDVYSLEATKVGTIDAGEAVFGITPNKQAMFDVILMQRASLRQGSHDVKTRREVSGGGRKPFRQKGTGRARQGSIRAPQWRGGGIAFGPTPRSYAYKLNRKIRRLAVRSILSQKVLDNNLVVLDTIEFATAKTKDFVKVMEAFKFERKTLFVVDIEEDFNNAYLAMRNLPNVLMLTVESINVYDVANADKLVMTKAAMEKAKEVLA
ncbi:MAG: 50S ribosomal protein L4 [Erysipelotrichaceae bacterium]